MPSAFRKKNIIIPVALTNTLEWYDFFLFAYFTPIFTHIFFPSESTTASLFSVFLVFSMGFLTRPLGSIIFGHMGDRFGRKTTLAITISIMGLSTAAIGCLPTYAQAGTFSPLLLIICRLLQGISLGGENTGNAVYMIEQSPPGKRGLFGSFSVFGTFLGGALASAVTAFLSKLVGNEILIAWAWRLPFWLGLFTAGLGLYFRLKMPQSPQFTELEEKNDVLNMPVVTALKEKPLIIFKIFLMLSSAASIYFVTFIYLPTYANVYFKLPLPQALLATSINNIMGLLLVVPAGYWSDKAGRRPIILGTFLCLTIFSYPLFLLAKQGTFWTLWLTQFSFHVLFVLSYTTLIVMICELFETKIRFSATAIANGFSSIVASLTPLIATSLISITGNFLAPSFVLIFFGLLGFLSVLTIHETFKTIL